MALEMIKTITAAEKQGEEIKQKAIEDGKAYLEECQKQRDALLQQAKEEAKKTFMQITEQVASQSSTEARAIVQEGEALAEQFRREVEGNLPKAVAAVFRKVVG